MKSIHLDDSLECFTHYKLLGHGDEYRRNMYISELKGNGERDQDHDLKRKEKL